MTSFEIYCYSLDTSFEIIILHCAEGASFSATPGFQELVYVCPYVTDMSDFHGAHSRRLHPVFPLLAFGLGFSGIPEIHEKLRNRTSGIDPAGPRFWTLFCHFFQEKFSFPSRAETTFL